MVKHFGWLALAALVATTGCGQSESQPAAQEEATSGRVTNVEVYPVAPTTFTEHVTLPVVVNPYREANLGLVSGGRVVRLHADKGDRVASGQVLLETETETLRAALALARANLEFQQGEFGRSEQLFRSGSINQSAFDAARLALAQAQSQHDIARQQLADATLEAPFAGTITMRSAEVGDVLGPGVAAFRLIDVDRVKVQAGIPERYVEDFRRGNTVAISFDAMPGRHFAGQINYIAPEASPTVRTFLCEMVVDNLDGAIRAGIMGNARIERRTFEEALLVPLDAVVETQAGRRAFVVVDDTLAAERAIVVQGGGGEMVVVAAGLRSGDQVITKGQHEIVAGDRVRVAGQYRPSAYQEVTAP
ncbi:MAG: efflux RND transporter periplasmic adaptor subunit [Candidatus Latescibacterota bacterium]